MSRLNENGSAEAATSPSHGSNNPCKETAVNRPDGNTMSDDEASVPLATLEEWAAVEFEPWPGSSDVSGLHTNSEWGVFGERYLPVARIAHMLNFQSKAELIDLVRSGPNGWMDLHDDISDMKRVLDGYFQLLDSAQLRLMSALAVNEITTGDVSQTPEVR